MTNEKIKLLIVDDEPSTLDYLCAVCQNEDLDIYTAHSGEDALLFFSKKLIPDFVITDISMGGVSGVDLLRWIKSDYPKLPVIVSTGFSTKELAIECLELGAVNFIEKSDRLEKIQTAIRSVTSQLKTNKQIDIVREQSKKMDRLSMVGVMTSSIIHDIKNPLFKIDIKLSAALKSLQDDLGNAEKKINESKKVLESVFKIIQTQLDQLSSGVKFDEGINLKSVIEDAAYISTPEASHSNIKFEFSYPEDDVIVNCSEMQIVQVISNLLNNSAHAIQNLDQRWVKLELADLGETVVIKITDSGSGIKNEIASKMFDLLYSTKNSSDGTGMGLGICKKIIGEHSGTLKYNDKSKNTQFIIELPKKPPTQN